MMTDAKAQVDPASYNARLFKNGFRRWLHVGRFLFVADITKQMNIDSVFELGCFDGRAIQYLAKLPTVYVGADTGMENGLASARLSWPQYRFLQVTEASQINDLEADSFDLSLCLETLEHISPDNVGPYLDLMAKISKGPLIVTLPVETGPVFLVKYIAKRMFRSLRGRVIDETDEFTIAEVMYSTLGLTSKVRRVQHKGFNHKDMKRQLETRFRVETCRGIPFSWLPVSLNFGVGLVCVRKQAAEELARSLN